MAERRYDPETRTFSDGEGSRVRMDMDLPGNSKFKNQKNEETPRSEKIVTGRVIQKNQTFGQKFKDVFSGESLESVFQNAVYEVVFPAIKDLLYDTGTEMLSGILFQGGRSKNRKSSGSRQGVVSYDKFYEKPKREFGATSRATHEFERIVLESKGEAEYVLDSMNEKLAMYGSVTVNDLYDMVGITGTFADNKWGWNDLRGASVERDRDGYWLNLPRTIVLD